MGQRSGHLIKEDTAMTKSLLKRCTKSYVNKELQIKTHLTEWPKSNTWTTPNADEDVEQQEPSFTVGENAK